MSIYVNTQVFVEFQFLFASFAGRLSLEMQSASNFDSVQTVKMHINLNDRERQYGPFHSSDILVKLTLADPIYHKSVMNRDCSRRLNLQWREK